MRSIPFACDSFCGVRRAIGIVRISKIGEREGERLVSPVDQRERIAAACERDGIELTEVIEEHDVSGGTPLEERAGLLRAVESVEAGNAQVVVAAYFDRLVRSLRVQDELVSRVEAAGGRVLAVDIGAVTGATASQWLSATILGAVAEHQRRSSRERSIEGQARAITRGAWPCPEVPIGYLRGDDGKLEPDPTTAPLIVRCFEIRAEGGTIRDVWQFLAEQGIRRAYGNIRNLLRSRTYLGEIHFGGQRNADAHPPLVDRLLWQRSQRSQPGRGRFAKSDYLLARLGVLRCGTCGARMSARLSDHGKTPAYACAGTNDCARHMAIAAHIVEPLVVEAVQRKHRDARGRASVEADARRAEEALMRAQADYDAGMRTFAGHEDEAAARERLAELRAARDQAREHLDRLGGLRSALAINIVEDWDRLTLAERRAAIRATVERVVIGSGRGAERVSIELLA